MSESRKDQQQHRWEARMRLNDVLSRAEERTRQELVAATGGTWRLAVVREPGTIEHLTHRTRGAAEIAAKEIRDSRVTRIDLEQWLDDTASWVAVAHLRELAQP